MAASLVYAFIRLRFDTSHWEIIVGFTAAVVFAAGLGFRYGAWYCEAEGQRPTFKLVLCPGMVFFSGQPWRLCRGLYPDAH